VTDPFDDLNERSDENERRKRLEPQDDVPNIPSPDVAEYVEAVGAGRQDTDIMREFHDKYRHLFCMDDAGEKGSEIFLYRKETGTWTSYSIREQINTYVSTIVTDYTRELVDIQIRLQATNDATEREALSRSQAGIIKLIQRCGKGNTISTIGKLLYEHLKTIHWTKRQQMNPGDTVLNCANGLVDLNTGKLHHRKPEHYLTRCTGTDYDPDIDYSRWEKAVWRMCGEDEELYEFLCMWIGYSITGKRNDRSLVVMWGSGSNGKSLLMDALGYALGNTGGGYACPLPSGFLETSRNGSDNNDFYAKMDLYGVRFAYGSETAEGAELKAEMVKSLTGEATLKGRHAFQNFKVFHATHKFTLATNFKPKLNADDDAMFARLKLFPCEKKFGPLEDTEADYVWDQTLLEWTRSKKGCSAVLRWAVECSIKYLQTDGIVKTPQKILNQIADHRSTLDSVSNFITACTVFISKPECEELEALSARGGTKEKMDKWLAIKDQNMIEKDAFYRMYRLWCTSRSIDKHKTPFTFADTLKTKKRRWTEETEDGNKEDYSMDAMKDKKVGAVWKWKWVRLSELGKQFYIQAKPERSHSGDDM